MVEKQRVITSYSIHYTKLYENGTIIRENKVTFSDTEISMLDLPPATYFLKLADDGKDVKVFKIIKTR